MRLSSLYLHRTKRVSERLCQMQRVGYVPSDSARSIRSAGTDDLPAKLVLERDHVRADEPRRASGSHVGLRLEVDLVRRHDDTRAVGLCLDGALELVTLLVGLEHGEERDVELLGFIGPPLGPGVDTTKRCQRTVGSRRKKRARTRRACPSGAGRP